MSERMKPQSDFFAEHELFLLNRAEDIRVVKEENGRLLYEVFLDRKNSIPGMTSFGEPAHTENAWLNSLLHGRNPGHTYMAEILNDVKLSQAGEVFRLATSEYPMRWLGAGGVVIIKDLKNGKKIVPLTRRANNTYYPNAFDAQGGLSESILDWGFPRRVAFRETVQELGIVEDNTMLFCRGVKRHLKQNHVVTSETNDEEKLKMNQLEVMEKIMPDIAGTQNVYLHDVTPYHKRDGIIIHIGKKKFVHSGLVSIAPDTAQFDFRLIFEMEVEDIDRLKFVDTEGMPKHPEVPLDREIFLFDPDVLVQTIREGKNVEVFPYAVYQHGQRKKPKSVVFGPEYVTPALEVMLEALIS